MRRGATAAFALLLPALVASMPGARAESPPRIEAAITAAAGPLRPEPGPALRGPDAAVGALVWLHPSYAGDMPPPAPPWMRRLRDAGWDLWRLDRTGRPDPIAEGAERLAESGAALRALGYARVAVAGHSRGGFIALAALRHPGVADAVLVTAPAAHGRSPERRPQALEEFRRAVAGVLASATPPRRAALALFADDPWDPDPAERARLFREAMAARGIPALVIDRPAAPRGHMAAAGEEFDALFGACLAAFLDLSRPPPERCQAD